MNRIPKFKFPGNLPALALVWISVAALGQDDPFGTRKPTEHELIQRAAPGVKFSGRNGKPVPNVDLPDHVIAEEGQLTLFADYTNAGEPGIPLFLVNRTNQAVVRAEAYLEFRDEDGHWVRAQNRPNYQHLDDGPPPLMPGQHSRLFGYVPGEGKPAKVRYSTLSRTPIVSNVGDGRFNDADRLAASLDWMNQLIVPEPLMWCVVLPTEEDGNIEPPSPREFVAGLHLFGQFKESAFVRRAAKRFMERPDVGPPELAAIRNILAKKWSRGGDDIKLLQLCATTLEGKDEEPLEGLYDLQRILAWKIARSLLRSNLTRQSEPEWKALTRTFYEGLPAAIKSPDIQVAGAAGGLLEIGGLCEEYVSTPDLFGWLPVDHPDVLAGCASAISRREEWDQLAEACIDMAPDRLPIVLATMLRSPRSASFPRQPDGKHEEAFWLRCAERSPAGTVNVLLPFVSNNQPISVSRILHPPLRAHLVEEMTRIESDPEGADKTGAYELVSLVKVVGHWKRKDDIELLKKIEDMVKISDPFGDAEP